MTYMVNRKKLKFIVGIGVYLSFLLWELPLVYGVIVENSWDNMLVTNSIICSFITIACFPFVLAQKRLALPIMCIATFLPGAFPIGGVLLTGEVTSASASVLSFGFTYIVYAILFLLLFKTPRKRHSDLKDY